MGYPAIRALVVGVALAGAAHGPAIVTHAASRPPSRAGAAVIAYAKAQLGKPYQRGGTGPGAGADKEMTVARRGRKHPVGGQPKQSMAQT
jgi:cell wall-associated NlpC family hydrolase